MGERAFDNRGACKALRKGAQLEAHRGLFENDSKTVRVLIPRDEFYADQSLQYVSEQFGGSLPKFIAAFTSKSKLSREEAEELKRMIDNASED